MSALVAFTVPDADDTDIVYKPIAVNNGLAVWRALLMNPVRDLQNVVSLSFQEPSRTSKLTKVRLKVQMPRKRETVDGSGIFVPTGTFISADCTFFLPQDASQLERSNLVEFMRLGFAGAMPQLGEAITDLNPVY